MAPASKHLLQQMPILRVRCSWRFTLPSNGFAGESAHGYEAFGRGAQLLSTDYHERMVRP
jgi:hypothetical protein